MVHGWTFCASWIFFGIWVILLAFSYWTESKKLITVIQLLAIALIFTMIIVAYATASGREPVRL